jgi:magnesium-transporting ATPase (P-type)
VALRLGFLRIKYEIHRFVFKKAKELVVKYGYNEIKDVGKKTPLMILIRQVKNNFIVYLLFIAMAISFVVDKDITAYTILAVIILVIFSGFIQEYKAEEAIESLKKMVTPISVVIRDGAEKEIDSQRNSAGGYFDIKNWRKNSCRLCHIRAKRIIGK